MKQSKVLGITGKIGSGKSTVSSILKEYYGFDIIDVDREYHWLLQNSNELRLELLKTFGDGILVNNQIDRAQLRKIVLSSDSNMEKLNRITHPAIFERIKFLTTEKYKDKPVVVDAALLFQIGLDRLCSVIWYIECEKEAIIERVVRRNGYNIEEIEKFLERQKDIEKYRNLANRVIVNNSDIENLKAIVGKYLKEDGLI
ncbi:dephospho-CoA kinase [Caldicellulosiruptor morganii]|uniref:Dephospho-CoA kinase n=1 Tax=Caldicellulosiruptor morganii TaxID=1387555 RepID=A0ABY7BSD6_9FIRM|nr:dephospho-CoA kinase [Caldicellulosiruptor morganii]WAM34860.1 dephospho-CoA kinase [Caldicellulosiruptor morganii]